MKKILMTLGLIFVILLGGIAGYFIGVNNQPTLTNAYVKTKMDIICEGAGWLSNNGQKSMSVEYEDYNSKEVDYNGREDFVKAFVLMAKFAFEEDGMKPNTYIVSEAGYTLGGYTYEGEMGIYYTLERNVAKISIHDFGLGKNVVLVLDNNEMKDKNTAVLGIYGFTTLSGQDGIFFGEIEASAKEVVRFSYSEIKTDEKDLSKLTKDNVDSFNVYDCNVLTGKTLNVGLSDMTNDEFSQMLAVTVGVFDGIYSIDFSYAKYQQSDALNKLYKALGYK